MMVDELGTKASILLKEITKFNKEPNDIDEKMKKIDDLEDILQKGYLTIKPDDYELILNRLNTTIEIYKREFNRKLEKHGDSGSLGEHFNKISYCLIYLQGLLARFIQWNEDFKSEQPEAKFKNQKNNNKVIIQWNENANVLTDIFRQLKEIPNKERQPAIGNSKEEIAIFLKENFSCFADTKLSTIHGMLKNNDANPNIPKTDRRIIIEKEK